MNYPRIIKSIYREIKEQENGGEIASYIPELANVDAEKFGIQLTNTDNLGVEVGDSRERFSIQSISKVFSLCLAYKAIGRELWNRVGVEPSGTPFNSLVQLEFEKGIPRNPLMNSGAIVVCDVLLGIYENPEEELLSFIRDLADEPDINYCETIFESEKTTGFRNASLVSLMKSFGNIEHETERVLDFYFKMCSIKMSCLELSQAFSFLANDGEKVYDGQRVLTRTQTRRMNAIMQTCGFYDEAGEFAYRVGLPGKSGVGGGIVAVHPGRYSISVWSPKLNTKGNSWRGVRFLEQFTTETEHSIF